MEKIFSFKSPHQAKGHLKNVANDPGKAGFYSEEEAEDTPKSKPMQIPKGQANQFPAKFKLDNNGYQTDESDDSPSNANKLNNQQTPNRQSKFKNLCAQQQHAGDQDVAEIEDVQQINNTPSTSQSSASKNNTSAKKKAFDAEEQKSNKMNNNNNIFKPNKNDVLKNRFVNQHQIAQVDSDNDVKKRVQKMDYVDSLKNHAYRHLIFGNMTTEPVFKKHLTLTYRGLVYAKKCLKGPSEKFIKSKQVQVPDAKIPKGRTLLLDLDETLIHSCSLKENPDHIVKAKGEYSETTSIGLMIRPYCHEFLQKLSQFWDIYVFTASSPSYASAIVNFLDGEGKYINGILNRVNCMETKNGFFIKDLRIVKNKDLRHMVLVDNLAHSFGFQIDNGIPILEWHNDRNDTELKCLIPYLLEAAQCQDVRDFNRRKLRLSDLADAKLEEL